MAELVDEHRSGSAVLFLNKRAKFPLNQLVGSVLMGQRRGYTFLLAGLGEGRGIAVGVFAWLGGRDSLRLVYEAWRRGREEG